MGLALLLLDKTLSSSYNLSIVNIPLFVNTNWGSDSQIFLLIENGNGDPWLTEYYLGPQSPHARLLLL